MIDNVKRLQRVLRDHPGRRSRAGAAHRGLQSATQIAAMGSQQFFNQAVAAGLTKVEANRIFQTAGAPLRERRLGAAAAQPGLHRRLAERASAHLRAR